jgi:hypothetical protein
VPASRAFEPSHSRSQAALFALGFMCVARPGLAEPRAPQSNPDSSPATVAADANEPAATSKKREARAHFKRGVELATQGDWHGALSAFESSEKIYPTRSALLNAAISLQRLQRPAEALERYAELKRKFDDRLTPDERRQVDAAIVELDSVASVPLSDSRSTEERAPGVQPKEQTHVLGSALQPTHAGELSANTHSPSSGPARAPTAPRSSPITSPITLDISLGLAFARSFGGSAEESCAAGSASNVTAQAGCTAQKRPFGGFAGGRVGYRWTGAFTLEVLLGYLALERSMVRKLQAQGERNAVFTSSNTHDRMSSAGLVAALGASYQFFHGTPLRARISLGVHRSRVRASIDGVFDGSVPTSTSPDGFVTYADRLQLDEDDQIIWIPFVAPELRFGFRLTRQLTIDAGLAVWFLFAPARRRTGDIFGEAALRRAILPAHGALEPGVVTLPNEDALGTIHAVLPTLGARWEF